MKQIKLLSLMIVGIILLSVVSAQFLEKKQKKKQKKVVKKKTKADSSTCLLLAKVIKRLGSKKTISQINKKMDKTYKNAKLISQIRSSINNLKKKATVVKKQMKTVPLAVYDSMTKSFFQTLFKTLLGFPAVRNSKAGKKIQKAATNLKKSKKVPFSNQAIRKLAHVTKAKTKPKKSRFDALKRYYSRVATQKAAAAKLDMSESMLCKKFKESVNKKWPYRQIRKIEREIAITENSDELEKLILMRNEYMGPVSIYLRRYLSQEEADDENFNFDKNASNQEF